MPGASETPHIYAAPDPENRQPPPEQGLRGEQGAGQPARFDLVHEIVTETGRRLDVEEQSGTAFAEVTGAADGQDPAEGKPGAD